MWTDVRNGCVIKTNKKHSSLLIYSNTQSSTCFEYSNYSSSGGNYCIYSIRYLPNICVWLAAIMIRVELSFLNLFQYSILYMFRIQ